MGKDWNGLPRVGSLLILIKTLLSFIFFHNRLEVASVFFISGAKVLFLLLNFILFMCLKCVIEHRA